MAAEIFAGPLFIVGLPRSGTKLIRDLLNQNPRIAIPESETHFIPYWIGKFGRVPDFKGPAGLERFFNEFCQTPFYENMRGRGLMMTRQDLIAKADLSSWPSIIETILRFYAPRNQTADFIWGDKTPGYVMHMSLLTNLFPTARFLQIVRDPRDYALSVKKAWGKHVYLAAEVWKETLLQARRTARQIGGRYQEIYYESLLSMPLDVLTSVCEFLDCDYVPEMTSLNRPSENLGDARGRTDIVRENTGKYLTELSEAEIRRIEEIAWSAMMGDTPYQVHYARQHRPLSAATRQALHLYNGWSSARFHIREKGLKDGISYFYRLHIRSSWR